MKKQFSAKLCLILITMILVCSCTTNTAVGDQIVATSIKLAQAYAGQGLTQQAIDVYEKALKETDDYRIKYNLSILYANIERYTRALFLIDECLAAKPDDQTIFSTKIKYLENQKNYGQIIAIYEKKLAAKYEVATEKTIISYLVKADDLEQAYSRALKLWESGTKDSAVADILYLYSPEQWDAVHKVLSVKAQ